MMTLATDAHPSTAKLAPAVSAPLAPQPVALSTIDGRLVSGGIAEFHGAATLWSATLRLLDRPGNVATLFFAQGVRDVLLRLADGRTVRARLAGTRFLASAERVCQLTGVDRIA